MRMERLPTTAASTNSTSGPRGRSHSGPPDMEAISTASHDEDPGSRSGMPPHRRAAADDSGVTEASALERRHQQLNQLFGIKVWKSSIRHRPIETRSAEVRSLYTEPKRAPAATRGSFNSLDNIIYVVLFGWWLWLLYLFVGAIFTVLCLRPLATMAFKLGTYYRFPFGKFILRHTDFSGTGLVSDDNNIGDDETAPLKRHAPRAVHNHATVVWGAVGWVCWLVLSSIILVPAHFIVMTMSWFSIFMIPMAKVNRTGIVLLFDSPFQLEVEHDYPGVGDEIELCVHQAANIYYYKYSVGGMNVIPVNLMAFVVFTVLIGYVPPFRNFNVHPYAKFAFSLLSIVPLAYYIGMALSSISAQTSLAVGAVLNATFGSIIELILFFNALSKGFTELTVAAVTGGLLGNMLLLPGVSMICGGIKFRNQSFNKISAGVSSVLIIISIVGIFTPTICYRTFGHFTFDCTNCSVSGRSGNSSWQCNYCSQGSFSDENLHTDPVYQKNIRPLTWIIAGLLPCAYIVGLLFTLKTHSDIYNPPPKDGEVGHAGEHDAPEWSRTVCIVILIVSTLLLALVSEELVAAIQPVLEASGITQAFMGVSLLAVIPSTAEYVNAIQFALQNNVALSIEIGSSGAVQIAMIQVPLLVLFSTIFGLTGHQQGTFPLIFPFLDVLSVIFCVLIVNYVSIEGRSNYFLGCGLSFTWILLIGAFYFVKE